MGNAQNVVVLTVDPFLSWTQCRHTLAFALPRAARTLYLGMFRDHLLQLMLCTLLESSHHASRVPV